MTDRAFSATWTDIEGAALHDPYLHAAVTVANRGDVSREDALMAAAVALSRALAVYKDELTACLMRCTCGVAGAVIRSRDTP